MSGSGRKRHNQQNKGATRKGGIMSLWLFETATYTRFFSATTTQICGGNQGKVGGYCYATAKSAAIL
jgi:hypothetical protein